MSEQFKSRAKSFVWRLGGMVAVAVLSFGIDNAADLHIPTWGVVISGLLVGEITKFLNTKAA